MLFRSSFAIDKCWYNLTANPPPSYCYQETTNNSNINDGACNQSYNGTYGTFGSWTTPENTYDADWGTNGYSNDGLLFINYTKPPSSIGAVWQAKLGQCALPVTVNITIPPECFNNSNVRLMLWSTNNLDFAYGTRLYCWNTTSNGMSAIYQQDCDGNSNGKNVWEEGIFWIINKDRKSVV